MNLVDPFGLLEVDIGGGVIEGMKAGAPPGISEGTGAAQVITGALSNAAPFVKAYNEKHDYLPGDPGYIDPTKFKNAIEFKKWLDGKKRREEKEKLKKK